MDIAWGNPSANIAKAEKLMAGQDAELFVLPEMWSTGYSVHPEEIAEDEQSSSALEWMKKTSTERKCAICGSLAIRDVDNLYRNRFYFVTPENTVCYDKRHLFTYAHEEVHYTRGDSQVIVDYHGVRFLLLVCYDLRFPVWSRWGIAGEYDAIVYVANWPSARQYAWDTLLRARAIENQCFVVAVNRVGCEHEKEFGGGSAVIDPQGMTIYTCQGNECTCQVDIDTNSLITQRESFPVLLDRDKHYGL
jgi:predicted amidohydrolase